MQWAARDRAVDQGRPHFTGLALAFLPWLDAVTHPAEGGHAHPWGRSLCDTRTRLMPTQAPGGTHPGPRGSAGTGRRVVKPAARNCR